MFQGVDRVRTKTRALVRGLLILKDLKKPDLQWTLGV